MLWSSAAKLRLAATDNRGVSAYCLSTAATCTNCSRLNSASIGSGGLTIRDGYSEDGGGGIGQEQQRQSRAMNKLLRGGGLADRAEAFLVANRNRRLTRDELQALRGASPPRPLEGGPVVHRLAVRDDHPLERQIEQGTQGRQGPLDRRALGGPAPVVVEEERAEVLARPVAGLAVDAPRPVAGVEQELEERQEQVVVPRVEHQVWRAEERVAAAVDVPSTANCLQWFGEAIDPDGAVLLTGSSCVLLDFPQTAANRTLRTIVTFYAAYDNDPPGTTTRSAVLPSSTSSVTVSPPNPVCVTTTSIISDVPLRAVRGAATRSTCGQARPSTSGASW